MSTALVPVSDGWVMVRRLVLDAVSSPITRAMYGKALDDFFLWWEGQGRPAFARATVQAHRAFLEQKGYSPSTVNQRLAAIRKLAREAALNGLLAPEIAAGIDQVPGSNSGAPGQGTGLPGIRRRRFSICRDPDTLKGKRDRALLALLIGCAVCDGPRLSALT